MAIFGLRDNHKEINWEERFRNRLDHYDWEKINIDKKKLHDVLDYLYKKGVIN
ncbi:hypothetical protein [Bacillus litorisediminis]|uniref:hypothetical protein n=1 Tax=Bacillus litorisediminis TaxID=2922713 RepID=UPI001FAC2D57|nr:hypothetical protein [Bacillus litorisediminis]